MNAMGFLGSPLSFINVVVSCLDVFEPPSEVRSDALDRMEVGE